MEAAILRRGRERRRQNQTPSQSTHPSVRSHQEKRLTNILPESHTTPKSAHIDLERNTLNLP